MLRPSWPYGPVEPHAPQWPRYELGLHSAVPIAFVKVHTDIVTFQVSEDVAHQKWIAGRLFKTRQPGPIIDYFDERGSGREEIVENSVNGIIDGFEIRYPVDRG